MTHDPNDKKPAGQAPGHTHSPHTHSHSHDDGHSHDHAHDHDHAHSHDHGHEHGHDHAQVHDHHTDAERKKAEAAQRLQDALKRKQAGHVRDNERGHGGGGGGRKGGAAPGFTPKIQRRGPRGG